MSYRNAIDLLTIAALVASARGVGLEDIERVLERDYRTAQRVIRALRERFPELLLGARRYVVAVDLEKTGGGIQHFRVDAIEKATVLPETFVRKFGFDLDEHAQRCFGSYQQADGMHDVAWRFSPKTVPRAEGFLFHPTQVVEKQPDGSLLVRFRASGLLEMCWHLYMWGDAVEVLSPPELARMVADHRRGDFPSMP